MARRVFFSFHYKRDNWRAAQVRNSWVTKPDREAAGFWDAVEWEEVRKKGEKAIQNWIDKQLEGTSVTVVLIGYETYGREYVKYEIKQSHIRGNGMLGIYVHKLKNKDSKTDYKGKNPFDNFYIEKNGMKMYLSEIYPTYDWVDDGGYNNFAKWVEKAAQKAGR